MSIKPPGGPPAEPPLGEPVVPKKTEQPKTKLSPEDALERMKPQQEETGVIKEFKNLAPSLKPSASSTNDATSVKIDAYVRTNENLPLTPEQDDSITLKLEDFLEPTTATPSDNERLAEQQRTEDEGVVTVSAEEAGIPQKAIDALMPEEVAPEEEVALSPEEDAILKQADLSGLNKADQNIVKRYVKRFAEYEKRYEKTHSNIRATTLTHATTVALKHFREPDTKEKQAQVTVTTINANTKEIHSVWVSEEGSDLHVVQLLPKNIGGGSRGSVSEVFHATHGILMALKKPATAKSDDEDDFKLESTTLSREVNILKQLKDAGGENVQEPVVTQFKGDVIVGNVGPKYNRSLLAYLTTHDDKALDVSNKKNFCLQLVNGFTTMQKAKVTHGDFKPENILVDEKPNQKPYLRIGDWGSARTYEDPLSRPYQSNGDCTFRYTTLSDLDGMHNISLKYDIAVAKYAHLNELRSLENEFLDRARRQDIFSLGVNMYCIFTKGYPYEFEDVFPDPKSKFDREKLKDSGCPIGLVDLIKEMVNFDIGKRPTLEQIKQRFKELGIDSEASEKDNASTSSSPNKPAQKVDASPSPSSDEDEPRNKAVESQSSSPIKPAPKADAAPSPTTDEDEPGNIAGEWRSF